MPPEPVEQAMRFLRTLGLISALTPVAYCAQLAFDLSELVEPTGPGNPGGWWQHASESGLAPAIIGLGAAALVFAIAFVLKFIGAIRSRPPGEIPSRPMPEGPLAPDGEADAEAMIARYFAKRHPDPGSPERAPPPPSAPARSFGRRMG